MKAIETRYKGHRFRSRLEARWAVFFDATWIRWEYEPEGFALDSGAYLPDFFLRIDEPEHPGAGYWVEIKPRGAETSRALISMAELCRVTGHNGFVVSGNPYPGEFEYWKFSRVYPHAPNGGLIYHVPVHRTESWPHIDVVWLLCTDVPWENVTGAMEKAQGARFEHDERERPERSAAD